MNLILLVVLVVVFIELLILRKRVANLEKFKEFFESRNGASSQTKASPRSAEKEERIKPKHAALTTESTAASLSTQTETETSSLQPVQDPRIKKTRRPRPVFTEPTESALGKKLAPLTEYLKNFFTTGNVVLKVGMIILFFGVSFLLKYAAQRNMIPIEFRLAGVALGGTALIIAGWILGKKRAGFGLVLQGGGIGILYLTVFAAALY